MEESGENLPTNIYIIYLWASLRHHERSIRHCILYHHIARLVVNACVIISISTHAYRAIQSSPLSMGTTTPPSMGTICRIHVYPRFLCRKNALMFETFCRSIFSTFFCTNLAIPDLTLRCPIAILRCARYITTQYCLPHRI